MSGERPIHVPSEPTAPHGGAAAEEGPRGCVACGAHHGSINAGRVCLEESLRIARRERRDLFDRVVDLEAAATKREERIELLEHALREKVRT